MWGQWSVGFRMNLLRKIHFESDFPLIFVKQADYLPQMIEKSDSKGLSLATIT